MATVGTIVKGVFDRIRGVQPKPDLAERTPSKTMTAMSNFMKQVPNPDKVLKYQSNGEGYQLYLDMPDRDPDLAGTIDQRTLAVASKPHEVQPFIEEDAESIEIAEFCSQVFENIPEFTKVKQRMAEVFWQGLYVGEVMWKITEAGYVIITDIKDRHNNRFSFDPDHNLQYRVGANSLDWHKAEDFKFVVLTYSKKGENPYGTPAAKGCYFSWWIKLDAGMKNWAIATEKFAMPTPHLKYKSSTTQEEKDRINEVKDTIMADQAFASSDNVDITLLEAMRQSGSPYKEVCEYVNQSYARRILGATLTSGEGAKGTQALGSVHSDVRDDIIQSDAECLMAAFNQILIWLVDFNFPNAKGYPKFIIKYEPPKDRKSDVEVTKAWVDMGLEVGEEYARGVSTIPTPEKGEKLLKPATPAVPVDPNAEDPNAEPKPKQDELSLSGNATAIMQVAKLFIDASQKKDARLAQQDRAEGNKPTSEVDGEVVALSDQPVNNSLESNVRLAAEDPSRFLPNLPPIADPIEGQPVAVQPAQSLKRYNIGSIATLQNASRRELRKVYNGFVRAILSEFGNLPGGSTAAQQHENMMQVIDDFIMSDLKPNLQAPLSFANKEAIRTAARQMAAQLGSAFNASEYESMVTAYLRVHAFEMTAFVPRATILDGIAVDTRARFAAKVSEAIQSGGDLNEIVTWLKGELPQLADWKATQIAITESRAAANWAVLESGIRSGLDLEAYWIVDPESCVLCQEWASRNPHTLREAQARPLIHPNCNDFYLLTPRGTA